MAECRLTWISLAVAAAAVSIWLVWRQPGCSTTR